MKKRQLPRSIKRLPKYGDGIDLLTKNKAGNMEFGSDIGGNAGVSAGLSTAGTLLSMMPDKTVRDSKGNLIGTRPSAGESIGSEALKYAGMGAAFGALPAAAGALVGATIGLINSNKQKQELDKARAEAEGRRMIDEEAMGSKYQDFLSADYQTNTKSFYAFGGYSDFANYPTTSLPLMVPPSQAKKRSLKHFPEGGKINTLEGDLISKVIMNRNRDKNFVQRAYALGQNPGMFTLQDPENFGNTMSHKMAWGEDETGQAYMYPTIMNPNNEAIKVPNQYADYISSQGYKKATGMKYAYGGIKRSISQFVNGGYGEPNSEIENNELVQVPGEYPMAMDGGQLEMANSNMFEADGQTHEEMNSNGTTGIETYLPQGSRVFSDRVKHNGRTIASIVSPISKKIGKLEERMEKMPSKALENTIGLLKNQEDFYFNKQEEIKQDKETARTLRTFMKGGYKYC